MKFYLMRYQRSSRIGYEWHNCDDVRWLNIWIGSPTRHRWWAFSLWIYL